MELRVINAISKIINEESGEIETILNMHRKIYFFSKKENTRNLENWRKKCESLLMDILYVYLLEKLRFLKYMPSQPKLLKYFMEIDDFNEWFVDITR